MEEYDVIVIGAGPAGLFSAINCSKGDKRVLILEKNKSAGKKLLISGAGQCNVTHEGNLKGFFKAYGSNSRFLKNSLYNFTNEDLIKFFEKRGLKLVNNEGKIFPKTLKASDILEILLSECKKNNVNIKYNNSVKKVRKTQEFKVFTDEDTYKSEILVIATGGKSYGNTGSTGDGYEFAKFLGHAVEDPRPALTPINIKNYSLKELSGISFKDIPISLWRNNKKTGDFIGDVLLTHKGLSGPGILNNSRYIRQGDIIKLNLLKVKSRDVFRKEFIENINSNGSLMLKTLLRKNNIPTRVTDKIIEISGVDGATKCAELNKKGRKKLVELLTELPMEVESLGGFHIAMATKGGVALDEVNSKTMESKIVKGLYFTGEVLDIDGDTGGYNIQAAFSTGKLAADSIIRA